jgi:uncharacterized OsmC-like protein
MPSNPIRDAIDQAAAHLAAHPSDALSDDMPAVATLEGGLRCRASAPEGAFVVLSDMPSALGGAGRAPTPGWLLRAAMANCDATVIAMRAAQLGIALSRLQVSVGSRSDDRGLLGVSEQVVAGPLQVQVSVRIAADGASADELRALVRWAEAHSPVNDALCRAVPVTTEVIVEQPN